MPATQINVATLKTLLVRSRLLGSADEVKSIVQRWQSEARDPEDVEALKKFLVHHRFVTEYQGIMLLRGHAEGFFLDQYKILEKIGRGRMAGVFKAVHALGQIVAIKVLPPSKARDAQLLARFQREAKLATQLRHANVVRAFQVGESGGIHFLVMEYLEGETVEEVLVRRRRLPATEAVRIVYQTLQGLQHLHDKGMVHRDLKPANLMLVPGMQPGQPDVTVLSTVKILDIGLGRAMFDENAPPDDADPQLTGEGVLLGTPDYLAPEQAKNARGVDIRADIYSLGCVLYHLLTGQPPFPETNVLTQIIKHATEMPRPLTDFDPGTPPGLQQILDGMMAKDPNKRFPTPERAAQALQAFLAQGTAGVATQELPVASPQYLQWLEGDRSQPPLASAASSSRLPSPSPTAPAAGGSSASRPALPTGASGAKLPSPRPTEIPTGKLMDEKSDRPRPPTPEKSGVIKGRSKAPGTTKVPAIHPADIPPAPAMPMPGTMPMPTASPAPVLGAAPMLVAAPMPVAAPLSAGPLSPDQVDVELMPAQLPPPVKPRAELPRSFDELDRRDYILAAVGGGCVLLAMTLGWGLSQLVRPGKKLLPEPPADNP